MSFRLHVERDRCQGHAQCAAVAPELFTLDDLGYLALTDVELSDDARTAARRGVMACPERAISIIEEER
jgi:ferredoxin